MAWENIKQMFPETKYIQDKNGRIISIYEIQQQNLDKIIVSKKEYIVFPNFVKAEYDFIYKSNGNCDVKKVFNLYKEDPIDGYYLLNPYGQYILNNI